MRSDGRRASYPQATESEALAQVPVANSSLPAGSLGPVMEMLLSAPWEGRGQAWLPQLPPAASLTAPLWTPPPPGATERPLDALRASGLGLRVPLHWLALKFPGSSVALRCQAILTPAFQFRFSFPDLLTVPQSPDKPVFCLESLPPALCARPAEVWEATSQVGSCL